MAKNIDFMGATFPDVPSIRLPQHEGGLVSFDDTSDGDIQPADVALGKIGYAQGQRVVGTATPSTPTIQSLSVTENGTYTAPSGVDGYSPVTVNVSGGGGGGLEYESGTWTPSADIARGEILWKKTHNAAPVIVMLVDATGTSDVLTQTNYAFMYIDQYKLYGCGMPYSSSKTCYAIATYVYRASSTSSLTTSGITMTNSSDDETATGAAYPRYWVDNNGFYPYTTTTSRFWRASCTYKWIAIWAPTT